MQETTGQALMTAAESAPTTLTEAAPPENLYPAAPDREVRFFSSPRTVTKKTPLSIILFQLITAGSFCLLLKLCALFSPELFANLRRYLEHLFLW